MKKVIALAIVVGLSACACTQQKIICSLQQGLVSNASAGIAAKLQCSNVSAISASLNVVVSPLGLCGSQQTGLIGDMVCPSVASAVAKFAQQQIPAAWGCKASDAQALLASSIADICKKAVPVNK